MISGIHGAVWNGIPGHARTTFSVLVILEVICFWNLGWDDLGVFWHSPPPPPKKSNGGQFFRLSGNTWCCLLGFLQKCWTIFCLFVCGSHLYPGLLCNPRLGLGSGICESSSEGMQRAHTPKLPAGEAELPSGGQGVWIVDKIELLKYVICRLWTLGLVFMLCMSVHLQFSKHLTLIFLLRAISCRIKLSQRE